MARPGTFQPGRSGNPGGKPKAVKDVVEAAREHSAAAIKALAAVIANPAADERAVVAAAKVLLDRAWGQAPQAIQVAVTSELEALPPDVRRAAIAALTPLLAAPRGADGDAGGPVTH